MAHKPPLILADEPTGCLDSATGRGIIELFLSLRRDGQTIFMVTHDAGAGRLHAAQRRHLTRP